MGLPRGRDVGEFRVRQNPSDEPEGVGREESEKTSITIFHDNHKLPWLSTFILKSYEVIAFAK